MSEPKTIAALLKLGERVLDDSTHIFDDHDTQRESEELLAFVLDVDADDLDDDDVPERRLRDRYLSLISRRAGGEPFPLITGRTEFYGLDFEVKPGYFIPRSSSELTVTRAARRLRKRKRPVVVDVCTGAGPIAIAIADEVPRAEVWGADIDEKGLAFGRRNARRLGVSNVHFKKSDMYDALPARLKGSIDVITGHIPYVPADELEDLPAEVREYEPAYTLTDQSADGLDLVRRAILEAPVWLRPGGWILLEVSEDMTARIRRFFHTNGFEGARVASDRDGLSVVVEARWPGLPRGPRN